jgi:toxin ParE1/3/4
VTRITWAPQALSDVLAIRTYLDRDSAEYADLVVERIVDAVSRLETHPRSGRVVPEVGESSLREVLVGRYRVVYRLTRGVAEILTVFHGARSFPLR